MNIGQAAKASGVATKTIRYYESTGLIASAGRSAGGYRVYSQPDILVLRFIKRARDLGFSIERTRRLIDLWQDKGRASADVKRLALEHLDEIEAKITQLTAMRDTVRELAGACDGNQRPGCPILRDLECGDELPATSCPSDSSSADRRFSSARD
ncbi:MAG TPA: Cu(I)-responsive transcriptional regulator [Stellaceae bacterium]|nr:Cu(I)-responsive transcriptional regulator [Stellaceae bacterium]